MEGNVTRSVIRTAMHRIGRDKHATMTNIQAKYK